jgi:hypothetical protein
MNTPIKITALVISGLIMLCLAALAQGQTVHEARLRWDTYTFSSATPQLNKPPPSNVLSLLERRAVTGQVPRQRDPQLSPYHLVVLTRDTDNQLGNLQVIQDPRLLRAELPGPTGELTGQTLRHAQTELLVVFNDHPKLKLIELWQPRWTEAGYILELIGTAPLK